MLWSYLEWGVGLSHPPGLSQMLLLFAASPLWSQVLLNYIAFPQL